VGLYCQTVVATAPWDTATCCAESGGAGSKARTPNSKAVRKFFRVIVLSSRKTARLVERAVKTRSCGRSRQFAAIGPESMVRGTNDRMKNL